MSFIKEFKEFAIKGNVIDLAVGVIIGGAFGKITTSLVNDVIMPLLTLITGKTGFENLFINLDPDKGPFLKLSDAQAAGASTVNYGLFISNIVDFLIIALVVFIFIKQINKLKPKPKQVVATTKECPFCRTAIHIEAIKCPNCTADIK